MIRYFTSHPTAANLLMLILMVAGIVTLPGIKRETFPTINSYEVEVRVPYPGASPVDVEQGICLPLEDALDGISFIDEKKCEARQNVGVMTVKMLEQGEFTKFIDDVKSAVDGIDDFPEQSETAIVKELGRTQNVVSVALTADLPKPELKDLAEDIKQRMLQQPLISLVEIKGFSKRQLRVEVSNANLRRYHLSLQTLAGLIAKQNVDLPLGSIKTQQQQLQLRFDDEKGKASTLGETLILKGSQHNEVKLADIATISDTFELAEDNIRYNDQPTALLKINKNTQDDSLDILAAVTSFIEQQQQRLPAGVSLKLTQDSTSIVKDRIKMLITNAWQGALLVFAVMWLFFTIRYAFWVVMGLPVSFLASFFLLAKIGITINMLSMVALLLALGILMDDAIVIAESIGSHIKHGLSPLQAAIQGTKKVAGGVFSSYLTTLCIFTGLVFISGEMGQMLKVIPIVLISVISVSLIEAFFILPNHLQHSLAHAEKRPVAAFRVEFERRFELFRQWVLAKVKQLIRVRYAFIGVVVAIFFFSVSMLASGVLKFSAFPNMEGDLVQARVLMPAGTPLVQTEQVVAQLLDAANKTAATLAEQESEPLLKATTVSYNENGDANENGPHVATVTLDLLTAEHRNTKMQQFIDLWRENSGVIPKAQVIAFKEPALGPSGRAIEIRISGDDFEQLAQASNDLKQWLAGYAGVNNVMDDLRPGQPEYAIHLKPGAVNLGLDGQNIAGQLRAAFQGVKVQEITENEQNVEITVMLTKDSRDDFIDFDSFPIVHPGSGEMIPLSSVATIEKTRGYSRIGRVNNHRTVTVIGDIDAKLNNTTKVIQDVQQHWLPTFLKKYPDLGVSFEGEVKRGGTTQDSMKRAMGLGLFGVFVLLSFQFRSYAEPLIVMVAIPLSLIGVIWGHLLMGLPFTLPSMLGFVSLAGIVVNDSILLVEYVKHGLAEGKHIHEAAAEASYQRFRAVLLTSFTTIAGMTPLLFETSLQAQLLIPLAASIVFGITTSTILVLLVVPCLYTILEDFGFTSSASGDKSVLVMD